MKAVWYEKKGAPHDVLVVGEMPEPHAGPGQVRVKMMVSGLNPSDTKGRGFWRGVTQMQYPRVVPHQDGAGVIDEVGPGVDPKRVGERVWVYEAQRGKAFGTCAEFTTVPAENAVPLPVGIGFDVGAALGVPAMTVALNTGAPVHGSPDSAMVQFLANAMARFYKLPHRSICNVSTSKSPDMQAGYDGMWGLFPAMLSGSDWITMGGGMQEGTLTVSYAKTVIDFEQLDAFAHFLRGPRFSDLDEIFETVKEVGPGGHFLGEAHTRKSDLFIFPSQDNNTFEQWEAEGRPTTIDLGNRKAAAWLKRYSEPGIDAALDEALLAYIRRRTEELG